MGARLMMEFIYVTISRVERVPWGATKLRQRSSGRCFPRRPTTEQAFTQVESYLLDEVVISYRNTNSAFSVAEVTTVRAVVGGRAYLPCDIDVPSSQRDGSDSDGGISLILWYHGDSHSRGGIPIYSLDARDLPLSRARPFPSAEYSNRAYFDVIARPPLLKIEPVQETDAGEFRCRVDYTRQRAQNRIVHLDVVGEFSLFPRRNLCRNISRYSTCRLSVPDLIQPLFRPFSRGICGC